MCLKGLPCKAFPIIQHTLSKDVPLPLSSDFIFSRVWDFADYYTGYLLPLTSVFEEGHLVEDTHTFRFPFQGEEIKITIQSSVAYDYNIREYYAIATNDFVVRMPVEYDGLVYCAEAFPGTFEAMNAMIKETQITTDLTELNDYFYFDPYAGLFSRIY